MLKRLKNNRNINAFLAVVSYRDDQDRQKYHDLGKNSSISSGLSVYTIEDGMRTASKLCSADGRERTVSG